MDLNQAKTIIKNAIDILPRADRKRIGFHAERRTSILCGSKLKSWKHLSDDGVSLAVMASTRSVPKREGVNLTHWLRRDAILCGSHRQFKTAVKRIPEQSLRKLLMQYA